MIFSAESCRDSCLFSIRLICRKMARSNSGSGSAFREKFIPELACYVGVMWNFFFIPEGLSTKRRSGQEGPQQFASDVVLPRYLQTSLPTSSPSLWKLRRCHSYPHSKIELLVTQRHVSKVKITTSDPEPSCRLLQWAYLSRFSSNR